MKALDQQDFVARFVALQSLSTAQNTLIVKHGGVNVPMPQVSRTDLIAAVATMEEHCLAQAETLHTAAPVSISDVDLVARLESALAESAAKTAELTAKAGVIAALTAERDAMTARFSNFDLAVATEVAKHGIMPGAVPSPKIKARQEPGTPTESGGTSTAGMTATEQCLQYRMERGVK